MYLRLTSNAAASPKDCNPHGLCRFSRLALLLLGHRASWLCSLVAPRQPAKASTARTTPIYEMGSCSAPCQNLPAPSTFIAPRVPRHLRTTHLWKIKTSDRPKTPNTNADGSGTGVIWMSFTNSSGVVPVTHGRVISIVI